jgi:hypothetical protein
MRLRDVVFGSLANLGITEFSLKKDLRKIVPARRADDDSTSVPSFHMREAQQRWGGFA